MDCCSTDGVATDPCPSCGEVGPVVGHSPVVVQAPGVEPGDWQFCADNACPIVYYLVQETVTQDQLRTRVGDKGEGKPVPVCFCFSHTGAEIIDDAKANNGKSLIKAEIKKAVAEGFCSCEHLNPSGQCCLADIHRVLKNGL